MSEEFQNFLQSIIDKVNENGESTYSARSTTSKTSLDSKNSVPTPSGGGGDSCLCDKNSFDLTIEALIEPFEEKNKKSTVPVLPPLQIPAELERKFTVFDRMCIRRNENIEFLKAITKPPKCLSPEPNLPIWARIPLENKIPLLTAPAGAVRYSRGVICEKLVARGRREDSFHCVQDTCEFTYDPLHDPNLIHYLRRPTVHKRLLEQGLVTSTGKVLCNLRDFNNYRAYYSRLYSADLTESWRMMYKKRNDTRLLRQQIFELDIPEERRPKHRLEKKLKEARDRARRIRKLREARMRELIHVREDREERIFLDNERRNLELALQNNERDHLRKYKLESQRSSVTSQRLNLFTAIEEKERCFSERQKTRREEVNRQNENWATSWLNKWSDYERRQALRDQLIEINRERILESAATRHTRIQRQRVLFERAPMKRKLVNKRALYLSSKYFAIWKKNVQNGRDLLKKSLKFESRWNAFTDVKNAIMSIRENSGVGESGDTLALTSGSTPASRPAKVTANTECGDLQRSDVNSQGVLDEAKTKSDKRSESRTPQLPPQSKGRNPSRRHKLNLAKQRLNLSAAAGTEENVKSFSTHLKSRREEAENENWAINWLSKWNTVEKKHCQVLRNKLSEINREWVTESTATTQVKTDQHQRVRAEPTALKRNLLNKRAHYLYSKYFSLWRKKILNEWDMGNSSSDSEIQSKEFGKAGVGAFGDMSPTPASLPGRPTTNAEGGDDDGNVNDALSQRVQAQIAANRAAIQASSERFFKTSKKPKGGNVFPTEDE